MSKELETLGNLSEQEIIVKKAIGGIYMDGSVQTMLHKTTVGVEFRGYIENLRPALQRLEVIDNANPSNALKCLEDIYRNGVFISDYDVLGKQHPTNISPETNKSISEQCDTIKQSLLKTQEQEKDKIFFKNLHNTKVKVPLVNIFNGLPQEKRFTYTEHIYYNWEEMKEALEEEIETLKDEKENLESKAKRQEKVLEIIKDKGLDYHSLSAIKYAKDFEDFKYRTKNLITKFLDYNKEEFELLKRYFSNEKEN